jgi:hypothetical protein
MYVLKYLLLNFITFVHMQEPPRPGESHNAESQSNQDVTAHHGQKGQSTSGSEDDSEVAMPRKRREKNEKKKKGKNRVHLCYTEPSLAVS